MGTGLEVLFAYWVCTKGALDLSVSSPTLGGNVLHEGMRRCMARGWESRRNQLTIFVREFFFPEKSIPSSLFSWNSALRATGSQPLVP